MMRLAGTLPGSGASMKNHQSSLLREINSLRTKEEVLAAVSRSYQWLDSINLVTCLYKLARIYISQQGTAEEKATWLTTLHTHEAFGTLLGAINAQLVQAQALLPSQHAPYGLNARCLSNLIWSLVKTDGVAGHVLGVQVVQAASPLVLHFLRDFSGQGLANLLWGYSKLPATYANVLVVLVSRMVEVLEDPTRTRTMDAQAVSNSIWAIAHMRCLPQSLHFIKLEQSEAWQGIVTHLLLKVAESCTGMLQQLVQRCRTLQHAQALPMEETFPCQALVKVVWSYSTLLGTACAVDDMVRPLILNIQQLMTLKLRASLGGPEQYEPCVHALSGPLTAQALSNLVSYAMKADLLEQSFLQAALAVATQHLHDSMAKGQALPYKPQELTVLLKACQLPDACDPVPFLTAISRLQSKDPFLTRSWGTLDAAELKKAMHTLKLPSAAAAGMQAGARDLHAYGGVVGQVPEAKGRAVLGYVPVYADTVGGQDVTPAPGPGEGLLPGTASGAPSWPMPMWPTPAARTTSAMPQQQLQVPPGMLLMRTEDGLHLQQQQAKAKAPAGGRAAGAQWSLLATSTSAHAALQQPDAISMAAGAQPPWGLRDAPPHVLHANHLTTQDHLMLSTGASQVEQLTSFLSHLQSLEASWQLDSDGGNLLQTYPPPPTRNGHAAVAQRAVQGAAQHMMMRTADCTMHAAAAQLTHPADHLLLSSDHLLPTFANLGISGP